MDGISEECGESIVISSIDGNEATAISIKVKTYLS